MTSPPPPFPFADLNGLVRFAERQNQVSARVPSHFNWPLLVADDINILITVINIDNAEERLNSFMKHFEAWFSNNSLIINTAKGNEISLLTKHVI